MSNPRETFLFSKKGWAAWLLALSCLLPLAAMAADAPTLEERRAEQARPRTAVAIDPALFDRYAGPYQLTPTTLLTVTREGAQFFLQATGQGRMEILPESDRKFFLKNAPAQISFVFDGGNQVTGLLLHQNGAELPAPRIDAATADRMIADLNRRLKDQTPMPGSDAALRRSVVAIQSGHPNYDEMADILVTAVQKNLAAVQAPLLALGPFQTVTFHGVDAQGWDDYDVKFVNGTTTWRIVMSSDGKIAGLLWQPGR